MQTEQDQSTLSQNFRTFHADCESNTQKIEEINADRHTSTCFDVKHTASGQPRIMTIEL